MYKILSAILHLGNITYDAVYSELDPANMSCPPSVLKTVAAMLAVDEAALKEALTVDIQITRGETIRKPYSVTQVRGCFTSFPVSCATRF